MRRSWIPLLLCSLACAPDVVVATTAGAGSSESDDTTEGDGDPGDGDPGDGDPGDGDPGDGDPGDGDPTGDGDGDPGDGDGEPCEVECEDTECALAVCEGFSCSHHATGACDELDGVRDIRLGLGVIAHQPRLDAYVPGEPVRIYGEDYYCDEDECGFTSWVVVRGEGDALLAAAFGRQPVDPGVLATLGMTEATWLAPLTRVLDDQDYCEIYDGGCNDDSWLQRATYDLVHETEGTARLIDASVAWAGGGFVVSTPQWKDGYVSCILPGPAFVYLFRDACEGSCPPPTMVQACEPALQDPSYDRLVVEMFPDADLILEGPFDAQCEVLHTELAPGWGGELQISVDLDCVFTLAQTLVP